MCGEHLHVVVITNDVCPDVSWITTIKETHWQSSQMVNHNQTTVATYLVAVTIGNKVGFFPMNQRQMREIRSTAHAQAMFIRFIDVPGCWRGLNISHTTSSIAP